MYKYLLVLTPIIPVSNDERDQYYETRDEPANQSEVGNFALRGSWCGLQYSNKVQDQTQQPREHGQEREMQGQCHHVAHRLQVQKQCCIFFLLLQQYLLFLLFLFIYSFRIYPFTAFTALPRDSREGTLN